MVAFSSSNDGEEVGMKRYKVGREIAERATPRQSAA